jgi:hypothetical protein
VKLVAALSRQTREEESMATGHFYQKLSALFLNTIPTFTDIHIDGNESTFPISSYSTIFKTLYHVYLTILKLACNFYCHNPKQPKTTSVVVV